MTVPKNPTVRLADSEMSSHPSLMSSNLAHLRPSFPPQGFQVHEDDNAISPSLTGRRLSVHVLSLSSPRNRSSYRLSPSPSISICEADTPTRPSSTGQIHKQSKISVSTTTISVTPMSTGLAFPARRAGSHQLGSAGLDCPSPLRSAPLGDSLLNRSDRLFAARKSIDYGYKSGLAVAKRTFSPEEKAKDEVEKVEKPRMVDAGVQTDPIPQTSTSQWTAAQQRNETLSVSLSPVSSRFHRQAIAKQPKVTQTGKLEQVLQVSIKSEPEDESWTNHEEVLSGAINEGSPQVRPRVSSSPYLPDDSPPALSPAPAYQHYHPLRASRAVPAYQSGSEPPGHAQNRDDTDRPSQAYLNTRRRSRTVAHSSISDMASLGEARLRYWQEARKGSTSKHSVNAIVTDESTMEEVEEDKVSCGQPSPTFSFPGHYARPVERGVKRPLESREVIEEVQRKRQATFSSRTPITFESPRHSQQYTHYRSRPNYQPASKSLARPHPSQIRHTTSGTAKISPATYRIPENWEAMARSWRVWKQGSARQAEIIKSQQPRQQQLERQRQYQLQQHPQRASQLASSTTPPSRHLPSLPLPGTRSGLQPAPSPRLSNAHDMRIRSPLFSSPSRPTSADVNNSIRSPSAAMRTPRSPAHTLPDSSPRPEGIRTSSPTDNLPGVKDKAKSMPCPPMASDHPLYASLFGLDRVGVKTASVALAAEENEAKTTESPNVKEHVEDAVAEKDDFTSKASSTPRSINPSPQATAQAQRNDLYSLAGWSKAMSESVRGDRGEGHEINQAHRAWLANVAMAKAKQVISASTSGAASLSGSDSRPGSMLGAGSTALPFSRSKVPMPLFGQRPYGYSKPGSDAHGGVSGYGQGSGRNRSASPGSTGTGLGGYFGSGGMYDTSKGRCRLDDAQYQVLVSQFALCAYPSTAQREALGQKLGLTSRSVQIWFQNRRRAVKVAHESAKERSQLEARAHARARAHAQIQSLNALRSGAATREMPHLPISNRSVSRPEGTGTTSVSDTRARSGSGSGPATPPSPRVALLSPDREESEPIDSPLLEVGAGGDA